MSEYRYTDIDGDLLLVDTAGWPNNTAHIVVHENAVFVPAAEAPKTAQAILDAAGVQSVLLTDLPQVTKSENGNYVAGDYTSYHQSSLSMMEKELKAVTAIWLRRKADEVDKERQVADAKAAEETAAKKAHDDLRTSPIALKALALYNRAMIGRGPYKTWDDTNLGKGSPDNVVRAYIRRVEDAEAKEKEAAEKLAARRDAVAKDYFNWNYEGLTANGKRVIDRIIELEDAQ